MEREFRRRLERYRYMLFSAENYRRKAQENEKNRVEATLEIEEIENAVNAIDDPLVREAIRIKYIEPLGEEMKPPTWNEIAEQLGDCKSGEALRVAVYREIRNIT